jgi:tetratricopeptide (TPR) repeat protein
MTSDITRTLDSAERAGRKGDACRAARGFASVLVAFPGNRRAQQGLRRIKGRAIDDLKQQAQTAEKRGALDTAERLWAEVAELAPADDAAARALALCRLELGRLAAARQALEGQRDCPATLDVRGRILRDLGDLDGAEACHRAALTDGPGDAAPLNNLGILARARGDLDGAAAFFRAAIRWTPDNGDLHYNLARAGGDAKAHLTALKKLPASDPAAHFALFERLHTLGQHDLAFAHLVKANALRARTAGFDPAREAALFSWLARMQPAAPASWPPLTGPRPVFIVGLPRSGTTLAERILGQSEGVQMAGELPVASGAIAPLLRQMQDAGRDHPDADDMAALRHRLDTGLAARSDGRAVLIDKMPLNFRWVGLLHAALPEARFVHMTRDAAPLAFSLLRHSFAGRGNGFCYDPAHLVVYMALHRALTGAWADRLGDRVHRLHYGDLVADPEAEGQALCAACGVPWSRDNLSPERSSAPVLTASNMQVRQPIRTGADDGWRPYCRELAPIIAALEAAGVT